MIPTLTEERKELNKYDNKFRRLVKDLRKNKKITFVDKQEEAKAVLLTERKFEEIESYLESAEILLANPDIVKELAKARKRTKKSKIISLDDLKRELGV